MRKEKKLSKDVMKKWISIWVSHCSDTGDCHSCLTASKCRQAYVQIKSLIKSSAQAKQANEALKKKPRVDYDFIKKEASLLVDRFDCECGLTHLQKIGIRTVLTEKGDLWDILQRAGVEVEEC